MIPSASTIIARVAGPRRRIGCRLVLLLFALTNVAAISQAMDDSPRRELSNGNVRVVVEPRKKGISILVDGISVSFSSSLVITTPGWAPHYYLGPNATAVETAVLDQEAGSQTLHLKHVGKDNYFLGDETISLSDSGLVQISLHGRFTPAEGQALIEWRMAALNPTLIVGMPFRARLKNGEMRAGTVPVSPTSPERAASTLAGGFDWIEFDSRIGLIRITAETDRDLVCYDYRKNRWADPAHPLFWFGDQGSYLSKQTPLDYRITIQLPDRGNPEREPLTLRAAVKTTPQQLAQTYPDDEPPTIIPRPKEAVFADGGFRLNTKNSPHTPDSLLEISISSEAVQQICAPAVLELRRFLTAFHTTLVSEPHSESDSAQPSIQFDLPPDESAWPAEGYELQVDAGGVIIRAADSHGFLYAVQTLKQLFHVETDGTRLFRAAAIRDWPSLSFRGVHLFTGGQGSALHEKLIRNVLAALKMNNLVLEAEYVEWDSHPELHHPKYGMPKSEVRRIVTLCRDLAIEITPLINSLGHCQWMFYNRRNLELAEDPEAGWAYCVTNPKTYEFLFEIYTEAIELFQPKWFHIGHDEFTHRGRYPYRAASRKFTAEELLMIDTLRLHDWLRQRGLDVMMWGDMLLGKGEGPDACHAEAAEPAAALRERLPDDILITDWHYIGSPAEKQTSLGKFHSAGLQTVAATWQNPSNIANFAQAAYQQNSRGLLQTTWAGYSLDPESFQAALPQYAAYVLAAECAWNADRLPNPATYPAGMYFLRLMDLSTLRPAIRAGWTTNLSNIVNYSLQAEDAYGWFGLGREHDLSMLPSGPVSLRGIKFDLCDSGSDSAPAAIVLQSKLTRGNAYPNVVTIGLRATASRVALLQATNFPCARGEQVGQYEFTYTDGRTEVLPLIYGENIFAYTERGSAPAAPIVWRGTTRSGQPVTLRVLLWDNPRPASSLESITIRSADAPGALMLIGLTGLDGANTSLLN